MSELADKPEKPWPMPSFSFQVNIGLLNKISFQEVSGLETETQVIEYRHSNSKVFSPIKMPGIVKFGNVTLKKGMVVNDDLFRDWYRGIKANTAARTSIVIELLDENSRPTMTWTLQNAWPTKITVVDQGSEGNEFVIDTLEIAHKGLVIAVPSK